MYLSKDQEFSNFLGDERISYLYSQNVRHVEQLVNALYDDLGLRAFRKLGWLDTDDLKEKARLWLELAERGDKGELAGGLTTNQIRSSLNDSPINFINGVQVSLSESDSGKFGSKVSNNSIVSDEQAIDHPNEGLPNLPASVRLYKDVENEPKALDQGLRGTCVAFATCAAAEHLLSASDSSFAARELSKQWLYYKAKLEDVATEHLSGTKLKLMVQACEAHGFVDESDLSYIGKPDEAHSLLFKASPGLDKLHHKGKLLKLTDHEFLQSTNVLELKATLATNHCVILIIPVYNRAWRSSFARIRGEIELPLQDPKTNEILDERLGFHAITLYGYNDTPKSTDIPRPGGGYFIFRNSWGESWGASRNETPRGYGMLPYSYISLYGYEALVLREITSFDPSGTSVQKFCLSKQL